MAVDLDFYDAELRRHNEHLRAAADVRPGDRVLDVGCGAGQSTREAARAAAGGSGNESGSALGVDVAERMLERARRLSDEQGLRNVGYVQADAATHPFAPASFDLCISRFGTMFFADPVAAFAGIGRALRPRARLVQLVWQSHDRNEWATEIDRPLRTEPQPATAPAPPAAPAAGPDPFSLADPLVTEGILAAAGFTDVAFAAVHEPVFYGPDVEAAYGAVLGLWQATVLLADLDESATAHALGRLRATLAAHDTGDGVLFDSQAWIVTAVRSQDKQDKETSR